MAKNWQNLFALRSNCGEMPHWQNPRFFSYQREMPQLMPGPMGFSLAATRLTQTKAATTKKRYWEPAELLGARGEGDPVFPDVLHPTPRATHFTDGKTNPHLIPKFLDEIQNPHGFSMTAVAHHIEFVPIDH
ncbi:hypothetical protein [Pseudophaeobacter sp. EL27]|uniref:hypothetical protein n=1 Tax=Pseudophaeobacter sp. EL27 TaxID=2107580 RepID=UPI0013C4CFFF|nr:hypothetical protein [Pseudophaeobacter sp. EL27]